MIRNIFLAIIGMLMIAPLRGMAPSGLKNIGNNCFMNAVFQCMSVMDDFKDVLRKNSSLYKPQSFAERYINFMNRPAEEVIDPEQVCMYGWRIMNKEANTKQDANEFLLYFLNHLMDEDLADKSGQCKQEVARLVSTMVSSVISYAPEGFVGERKHECITPLPLALKSDDILLYQCLHRYFKVRSVDYTLPSAQQVCATQKCSLEHTGKYFIMTLKRTFVDAQGNEKRHDEPLSFTLKNLDVQSYCRGSLKNPGCYDLYGVIMHKASAAGGHYTAYVKSGHTWYYCDDAVIKEMSDAEMHAIAQRGYGATENFVPTTLMYQRSREPYDVLHVMPWVSAEDITHAYNNLCREYGPLSANNSELGVEIIGVIRDAYNQLMPSS